VAPGETSGHAALRGVRVAETGGGEAEERVSSYGWTEKDLAAHMAKVRKPLGGVVGVDVDGGFQDMELKPNVWKRSKYRNRKTLASDGVLCDSLDEARRWEDLLLLHKTGVIRALMPHPSFPLHTNGKKTGRFTFDALYIEPGDSVIGVLICEDTKSAITAKNANYRTRLRQFQACYPHITVREHIPSK
jgi:hypothetical protein